MIGINDQSDREHACVRQTSRWTVMFSARIAAPTLPIAKSEARTIPPGAQGPQQHQQRDLAVA